MAAAVSVISVTSAAPDIAQTGASNGRTYFVTTTLIAGASGDSRPTVR
jgi:hypothetical protein